MSWTLKGSIKKEYQLICIVHQIRSGSETYDTEV